MRNQIANLYNATSTLVAVTREVLAEKPQSARETTSLLYNTMVDNIEHGQERLKDIVGNGRRRRKYRTDRR